MNGCVLCGENNWYKYCEIENGSHDVLICKVCSLSRLEPFPTSDELNVFYSKRYREEYSKQESVSEKVIKYEQWRADNVIEIMKPFFQKNYRKVLDIGCSSGTLLKNINNFSSDLELYGLEMNDNYRKYIVDNGIVKKKNISNADINTFYKGMEGSFDMISIVHVLEHLKEPLKTLSSIQKLLSEKGVLYIEVPNMKTPYNNLEKQYFAIYHLFNFTDYTLEKLLIKTGFKITSKKIVNNTSVAFICKKTNDVYQKDIMGNEQFKMVLENLNKYKRFYFLKVFKSKISLFIHYQEIKKWLRNL